MHAAVSGDDLEPPSAKQNNAVGAVSSISSRASPLGGVLAGAEDLDGHQRPILGPDTVFWRSGCEGRL